MQVADFARLIEIFRTAGALIPVPTLVRFVRALRSSWETVLSLEVQHATLTIDLLLPTVSSCDHGRQRSPRLLATGEERPTSEARARTKRLVDTSGLSIA